MYGTNSITIPADMDMSDDYREPISPGSNASSFQHPSSIDSTHFNNSNSNNYFSQSVPSFHHNSHSFQQQNMGMQSPTTGLFPQLGSTLPEPQQAAFFAATPNESSPSPAALTTSNNAGAMSFEDLLTMYYVNGNNAAAAAAAAVAVTGTSPQNINQRSNSGGSNGMLIISNNEAPSLSQLSLPQSQGTIFFSIF